MLARLAHLEQQVEHGHAWRHDNDVANDVAHLERLLLRDAGQHVLDVDHADDIVERFTVDRHAGMGFLGHAFDQRRKRGVDIDRHDVGARHHGIDHGAVAQLQDIGEEHPLVRGDRSFGFAPFLDQFLYGVAQRRVAASPQDRPQPAAKLTGEGILLVGPVFTGRSTAGYVCHCHMGWSVVAPSAPVSPCAPAA